MNTANSLYNGVKGTIIAQAIEFENKTDAESVAKDWANADPDWSYRVECFNGVFVIAVYDENDNFAAFVNKDMTGAIV